MKNTKMKDFNFPEKIYSLISQYVYRKTESRSGIKWEDFKDNKVKDGKSGNTINQVQEKYREARERICTNTFFRLRSARSREDFLELFTGSIFSVPQCLKKEDLIQLFKILQDEDKWEDVKSLSMLAISTFTRV